MWTHSGRVWTESVISMRRVPEEHCELSYWRRGKTENHKLIKTHCATAVGGPNLGNAFWDLHADDDAVGPFFRSDRGRCLLHLRFRLRRRLLLAAGRGCGRGRISVCVQVDVGPIPGVLFRFRFPLPSVLDTAVLFPLRSVIGVDQGDW